MRIEFAGNGGNSTGMEGVQREWEFDEISMGIRWERKEFNGNSVGMGITQENRNGNGWSSVVMAGIQWEWKWEFNGNGRNSREEPPKIPHLQNSQTIPSLPSKIQPFHGIYGNFCALGKFPKNLGSRGLKILFPKVLEKQPKSPKKFPFSFISMESSPVPTAIPGRIPWEKGGKSGNLPFCRWFPRWNPLLCGLSGWFGIQAGRNLPASWEKGKWEEQKMGKFHFSEDFFRPESTWKSLGLFPGIHGKLGWVFPPSNSKVSGGILGRLQIPIRWFPAQESMDSSRSC